MAKHRILAGLLSLSLIFTLTLSASAVDNTTVLPSAVAGTESIVSPPNENEDSTETQENQASEVESNKDSLASPAEEIQPANPSDTESKSTVPDTIDTPKEEQAEAPVEEKETVNFTQAGPLFTEQAAFNTFSLPNNSEKENGLILSKKLIADEESNPVLQLEAYTTGIVSEVKTPMPVDVVLVLDQSGSMRQEFSKRKTKQEALEAAVNNFIDKIQNKYSETSDHRISIVQFKGSASIFQDWMAVNEKNADALKNKIKKELKPPLIATTATDDGMKKAAEQMNANYKYNGSHTTRQKVVIVFTDGEPSRFIGFSMGAANDALNHAKNLKNESVIVYSIGIFKGANPNEIGNHKSDGTVRMNRFMNLLSSNYKEAVAVDQATPEKTGSNYYLSANSPEALEDIFISISEQIGTPSIYLSENTVLRDILTNDFELRQTGANSAVKVYKADKLPNGQWGEKTPFEANVSATQKTVEISGFNFDDNFVSEKPRGENFYGRKVIVEIPIQPDYKNTFGGNGLATNEGTSGVYLADTLIGAFEVPYMNVPIRYTMQTKEQTIYLGNAAALSELLNFADGFTPNGVNNQAVNITYTLKKEATILGTYEITAGNTDGTWQWQPNFANGEAIEQCTPYALHCEVKSSRPAADFGTAAESVNLLKQAMVHVLVPVISYEDTSIYLGENTVLEDRYSNLSWQDKTQHTNIPDPIGQPSSVSLTVLGQEQSQSGNMIDDMVKTDENQNHIFTPQAVGDYHFKVQIKIAGKDVTSLCKVVTKECSQGNHTADRHFSVHVKGAEISIGKTFKDKLDKNQAVIVRVERESTPNDIFAAKKYAFDVVLQPNNQYHAVIKNLPLGTYTIKEQSAWSWRYSTAKTETVELTAQAAQSQNTIENSLQNKQWLSGHAESKTNIFDKSKPDFSAEIGKILYETQWTA